MLYKILINLMMYYITHHSSQNIKLTFSSVCFQRVYSTQKMDTNQNQMVFDLFEYVKT